ncbi:MAG: DUF6434 domain-containing protein [Actinomycetota bacterium]
MPSETPDNGRPALSPDLDEAELRRWYWTLEELRGLARTLGVSASGRKADVTERIAAALSGRVVPAIRRSTTANQMSGPLTRSTVVPPNQRATVELRRYFEAEIGSSFRFNGHMRALLKEGDVTLGQAVEHWHHTVGTELPPQSESLEFNRFTKAWHRAHPDRSPDEARAAWLRYRALPTDQRPAVADA